MGYSNVRVTEWPPNELVFHKKAQTWVPFWSKISLDEDLISQKFQNKIVKSAIFEADKPLEMGPNFQKFKQGSSWIKSLTCFAITHFCNHCNIKFDPIPAEVICANLPNDHEVQGSLKYVTVTIFQKLLPKGQ